MKKILFIILLFPFCLSAQNDNPAANPQKSYLSLFRYGKKYFMQPGTNGYVLSTSGDTLAWVPASGGGTVTSVGLTVPSGFSVTGSPVTSSGTLAITGTLNPSAGGTGLSSYTTGDIIYASGATALSRLAGVATGNALISGGVSTAPSWGKIGLTTHVSGTLPIANGGTNLTALGTSEQLLRVNTGGTALEYVSRATGDIGASGRLAYYSGGYTIANSSIYTIDGTVGLSIGGVGTTLARGRILNVSTGADLFLESANSSNQNLVASGNMYLRKSLGDLTTPSNVTLTDVLFGGITAQAYANSAYRNAAQIRMRGDSTAFSGTGYSGRIVFATNAGTGNLVDRMVIKSDGKIGMGTMAPSQLLDVAGAARIRGALYDSNNSAGTSGEVLVSTGTGTDWNYQLASSGYTATVTQSGSDTLQNSATAYGHFHRVGDVVTFTVRIEVALTNTGNANTVYFSPPIASNFTTAASDVIGVAGLDSQGLSSANTPKQRALLFASTSDDKIGISFDPVGSLAYPENRVYISASGSYIIQ